MTELASDVLQEVFINIWRKIETYDQTKGSLIHLDAEYSQECLYRYPPVEKLSELSKKPGITG